ncbi:MAG TPA: NADPH:quinone oxidoreductase family protein [Candidatus Limnocylindria bacterium]
MRALRIAELTGADGLRLETLPDPTPGDGALLDVKAVGIGYSTLLRSIGKYQDRWEPPYTLDGEVAGVVIAAPAGSGWGTGERVAAPSAEGAAAERVVVPAGALLRIPDDLSFAQAACLRNLETALFALDVRGRVKDGETVLVHGAAGGSGIATLQIARALGCRTIAIVSSDDKAKLAAEAGADHVLRADTGWKDETLRLTDGAGVDAVFDPVGGETMLDTIRSLREGGRWIIFGFTGGIPAIPANRVMLRNIDVVGAYRTDYFRRHPETVRAIDRRLIALIEEGKVRPIVGTRFPFDRGADALRSIAARESVGQVVLEP